MLGKRNTVGLVFNKVFITGGKGRVIQYREGRDLINTGEDDNNIKMRSRSVQHLLQ